MPSFILELLLKTPPQQMKILNRRLEAARHLYNCCLNEALNRYQLVKESLLWQRARKTKNKKLYKETIEKYKFSEYSLHSFVKEHQKKFSKHIDSSTGQKIATRAFLATKEYFYKKRGRPRYKGKNQFRSVEGKSNVAGLKFVDGKFVWKDLILEILYDKIDKDEIEAHGLSCKTKYVRFVKRFIKGKERFYIQLIQNGKPKIKARHQSNNASLGLDIGPSSIAYVSENSAELKPFVQELNFKTAQKKKLQKKLCRKRRLNTKLLNRAKKIKNAIAEIDRVEASTRKKLHGELSNIILKIGCFINTEKLSYRSFQKNFGRSVKKRAPGKFLEILSRKAENAGGRVFEFSSHAFKLSQLCHNCGSIKKKKLSDRHHVCDCGVGEQRDLYSAFLALFVNEKGFDKSRAHLAWPSVESLLERALSKCSETMSGEHKLESLGLHQRPGLPH